MAKFDAIRLSVVRAARVTDCLWFYLVVHKWLLLNFVLDPLFVRFFTFLSPPRGRAIKRWRGARDVPDEGPRGTEWLYEAPGSFVSSSRYDTFQSPATLWRHSARPLHSWLSASAMFGNGYARRMGILEVNVKSRGMFATVVEFMMVPLHLTQ